jgi:hypothetical protein
MLGTKLENDRILFRQFGSGGPTLGCCRDAVSCIAATQNIARMLEESDLASANKLNNVCFRKHGSQNNFPPILVDLDLGERISPPKVLPNPRNNACLFCKMHFRE